MNSNKKGRRNELEAIKILSSAFKASEAKANNLGHDFLGIADVIGTKPGKRMKFVQVKTNRKPAKRKRYRYAHMANKSLPLEEHADFEIWVRKDREGWDLYKLQPFDPSEVHGDKWADMFDHFATINICKISRAKAAYRFGILGYDNPGKFWDYNEKDWEIHD